LAGYEIALLTSLPILCFGVGAFAGPWLVRRFGLRHSFTLILATMTIGILIRPWFGFGLMLSCSVAIGLAIALSNVLFPTLIRSEFPNSVPRMTAFYTLVLPIFASIAAATAVPWMRALGDWRLSTALWGLPGLAAVFVWQLSNRSVVGEPTGLPLVAKSSKQVWRSPVTWGIVGFFGLQSVGYYGVINWLPSILISQGYGQSQAGEIIGFTTMIVIPFGFAITINLKRFNHSRS
jgi:CP family cyanate transporter-like MFS transporter